MNSIGDDIVMEISSHLDAVSITCFLSISKRFWRLKQSSFFDDSVVPYQQYIKNEYWNRGLRYAVKKSNITQIMYFISKGADNMNNGMYEAAKQGNRYLVDFFIQRGACRWSEGLRGAAFGGHMDLIEFFWSKGTRDLSVMAAAARGGHKQAVDFFVSKGAHTLSDWNNGLGSAAAMPSYKEKRDIQMELVQFFLSKRADPSFLRHAAHVGNRQLIHWAIERGYINWNHVAREAAYVADLELVKYCIQKGASINPYLMDHALMGGNTELIEFLAEYVNEKEIHWNMGLEYAAKNGSKQLVQYFIQKGANDWSAAFCSSAEGGHIDLVNFFIEKGANHWTSAIQWAITGGHSEMIKYLAGKDIHNEYMKSAINCGDLNVVKFFAENGFSNWRIAVEWAEKSEKCGNDIREYVAEWIKSTQ